MDSGYHKHRTTVHSPINHTDPPDPLNPPRTHLTWPFLHFKTFYAIQTKYFLKPYDTQYPLTHWPLTHHLHRPTKPTIWPSESRTVYSVLLTIVITNIIIINNYWSCQPVLVSWGMFWQNLNDLVAWAWKLFIKLTHVFHFQNVCYKYVFCVSALILGFWNANFCMFSNFRWGGHKNVNTILYMK